MNEKAEAQNAMGLLLVKALEPGRMKSKPVTSILYSFYCDMPPHRKLGENIMSLMQ